MSSLSTSTALKTAGCWWSWCDAHQWWQIGDWNNQVLMHPAFISNTYLPPIIHKYTQSTWTKLKKVNRPRYQVHPPSGSHISDLDEDEDKDCEVPSSCIEELELQIPELGLNHFVDLEEHRFCLQEIEVLVSVFHLPSWIFSDVLISGWNLLSWSWWFSLWILVFATLSSVHELEKCRGWTCIKTGWKHREGINIAGKFNFVYMFPNPDDISRILLSPPCHIPKTNTMQYPKCNEFSLGHERLLPRLQSLMLWSSTFNENIQIWLSRAWGH